MTRHDECGNQFSRQPSIVHFSTAWPIPLQGYVLEHLWRGHSVPESPLAIGIERIDRKRFFIENRAINMSKDADAQDFWAHAARSRFAT